MAASDTLDFQKRVEALRPWRYNHQHNGQIIRADDPTPAAAFDSYVRQQTNAILDVLTYGHNRAHLRAIDMGCLEGHYTDMLCGWNFGEVVAVDISDGHLERARFLLKEVKGHANATIVRANVCSDREMAALGKFNLVFCHGLLYHLRDPLKFFDACEAFAPDDGPFIIWLSTQYKLGFGKVVSPRPIAEYRFRKSSNYENLRDSTNELNMARSRLDGSVFESCSLRLNPAAVFQALRTYGYRGLISYDDPGGCSYSYHSNLIITRDRDPDLLQALNDHVRLPGVQFSEWDGCSVNGYAFRRDWRARLVRFVLNQLL